MSKLTSTCGMPRGAGGIPSNINLPSDFESCAIGRSPCNTCTSTEVWLSAAVENIWLFLVGTVVFFCIKTVFTPPNVSIPSDKGVTSSKRTSFTSPCIMPACTAAPIATTSSGLIDLFGSLPNKFRTASCIAGILVCPPTRTTS